jgi:hypothetical protein
MVMLLFGILGFAALVIDLGFARLTQRQMQTAVDEAALEGLRWRDAQLGELPQAWLNNQDFQNQVNGSANPTDAARRWAASQSVGQLFDDNLNAGDDGPGTGDPGGIYGAGPLVPLPGGNDTSAIPTPQLIGDPTNAPVYKPVRNDGTSLAGLDLNASNVSYGDLVAGTYNSGNPSAEADDYTRADFTGQLSPTSPPPAFLARMRRTPLWNVPGSADDAAGISSGGPPIYYLFGLGTMMNAQPGSSYSPREQGVSVRATAIAAAEDTTQVDGIPYTAGRAKAAGPPYQGTDANNNPVNIPGITPFAVKAGSWPPATSLPIAAPDTTAQTTTGPALSISNTSVVVMLGQRIGGPNVPGADPTVAQSGGFAYVPVYDDITNGAGNTDYGIVVGFGCVQSWTISGGANSSLSLTPTAAGQIGYGNVTGVLPAGLNMDTTAVSALFISHRTFSNPLYAPVLVDHYLGPNATGGN